MQLGYAEAGSHAFSAPRHLGIRVGMLSLIASVSPSIRKRQCFLLLPFPMLSAGFLFLPSGFMGAGSRSAPKALSPFLLSLPSSSSQQRVLLCQVPVHVQDRVRRLRQPSPAGGLPLRLPAVPQPGPQAVRAQPLDPLLHAGRKRRVSWFPATMPWPRSAVQPETGHSPVPRTCGWPGFWTPKAASTLLCLISC